MATYPLCAYKVTVGAVTLNVTIAGTTDALVFPAGEYWGLSTETGADTTSAAHRLAALLVTHSEISGSATWAASIQLGAATNARAVWRITYTGAGLAPSDTLTVASTTGADGALLMSLLGLQVGGSYSLGALGYLQASRRQLGVWSPGALGTRLEPVYLDIGEGAVSPYDASAHDRVRVGRRLLYTAEWPYVEAADVSREIGDTATQSDGYRVLAGREADETLGTLDDLLGAAGSGSRIRLIKSESESVDCVLDADGPIQRSEYTREESVGGRRYRVVMPLIAASDYTGVYT
jgi:hypothetical protein